MNEQALLTAWHGPENKLGEEWSRARGSKHRGSYKYWVKSVNRLSIMTGLKLEAGELVDGLIPWENRFYVLMALNNLLDKYKHVTLPERQPLRAEQVKEIKRVCRTGIVTVQEDEHYDNYFDHKEEISDLWTERYRGQADIYGAVE